MTHTRTLKTTISIKVPPQSERNGLGRLELQRRRVAVSEATTAYMEVMESYGIQGSVPYTSSYAADIDRYSRSVPSLTAQLKELA